jgi:oxygen-independent coproporphyrinogen-3 oxidase
MRRRGWLHGLFSGTDIIEGVARHRMALVDVHSQVIRPPPLMSDWIRLAGLALTCINPDVHPLLTMKHETFASSPKAIACEEHMHTTPHRTRADSDTASAYAMYPSAAWFVEAFDEALVTAWVKASGGPYWLSPVSIDVGLPAAACDQCARQNADCVDGNICVRHLEQEMALYRAARATRQEVCDIHWSTGMATLPDIALQQIHRTIGEHFELKPSASFTVQIDLSSRETQALSVLQKLGADTVHIGTARTRGADFELACQQTLAARAAGFRSIAVDFPVDDMLERPETPLKLIDALISCGPTRVVLTRTSESDMLLQHSSDPAQGGIRHDSHEIAAALINAGYQCIATNVFALRTDTHAVAQRQGRLTRHPYGYSTHPVNTLLALGHRTIGYIGALYYQNQRLPQSYSSMLRVGRLPVERGLFLTHDDLMRRTIIMSISTNLFVDIASIETAYGVDFRRVFADEWKQLEKLERAGLLTIGTQDISLTPAGHLASNRVCRIFDLQARLLAGKIPKGGPL